MSLNIPKHKQFNRTKPLDIKSEGLISLINDLLHSGFSVRIKVSGCSMKPFLKGGDIVTLQKISSSMLNNGDIVFFINVFGHPILHRIVRFRRAEKGKVFIQTKGDGLLTLDASIDTTRILARVNRVEILHTINQDSSFFSSIDLSLYRHRIIASLIAKRSLIQYYWYRIVNVCSQNKNV